MRPDLALKHVAARGLPDRRAVNPPVQRPWGAILVDEHLRNVRPPLPNRTPCPSRYQTESRHAETYILTPMSKNVSSRLPVSRGALW